MSATPPPGDPADRNEFARLTEHMLARAGVSRSTMMGLPCLRIDGAFFASYDTRTDRLLVKLPAPRVQQLVAVAAAEAFAPAGRTFREWAAIPSSRIADWSRLCAEALDFVAGQRGAPSAPRSRRQR
ncbi:hypothetical protein [Pseudofrankia sp. BMG5.37]|uniref:hypothetical protein n=1 Tax=Pseudofrankia sp. BMG5.37 TaxID=3050035 RepID=UPI002893C6B9|nr:hypothetical protein [Pseudofrankia sp. BMG5.37]MDT3442635.1 hypothetical protein [Pseudofrankia sp. BMG5.37]